MSAVCISTFLACGYHVSGHADLVPRNIKTIAVPPFGNATPRYKLADKLAADITREFISRTRYRVVADPGQADAVLSGAVVNFAVFPTVFDPVSQRASAVQAVVTLQISLTDRHSGKLLFNRPGMDVRERYESSVDQKTYFDESGAAMERLSRDVARSVVSAVLENF